MEAVALVSPSIRFSTKKTIVLKLVFCLISLEVNCSVKLSASSWSVVEVSMGKVGLEEVFSDSRPSRGVSGQICSVGVKAGTKGAIPV